MERSRYLTDSEYLRLSEEERALYPVTGILHWRASGEKYIWHFVSEAVRDDFAKDFERFATLENR